MSLSKRDATPEEEASALKFYKQISPETDYEAQLDQCKQDGLKTEVCDCGKLLPAFIHFVRCDVPSELCPMKTTGGKSLLDTILGVEDEPEPESASRINSNP